MPWHALAPRQSSLTSQPRKWRRPGSSMSTSCRHCWFKLEPKIHKRWSCGYSSSSTRWWGSPHAVVQRTLFVTAVQVEPITATCPSGTCCTENQGIALVSSAIEVCASRTGPFLLNTGSLVPLLGHSYFVLLVYLFYSFIYLFLFFWLNMKSIYQVTMHLKLSTVEVLLSARQEWQCPISSLLLHVIAFPLFVC